MRPFRFAVQLRDADGAVAAARHAERVGYDVVHVPDHLGHADPFGVLAAVASATERIRLGTLVLNNEFWPVPLTARAAATLDRLSGGRFELGLGAGHMKSEFDAAGWPFHTAAGRVTHLEQDARILRRLLDGETVTTTGGRTRLTALAPHPLPRQRRLPLLIGGNGDRVLRLAAEVGDIVGLVGFSQREGTDEVDTSHFSSVGLDDRVAHVRAAAGERWPELELNVLVQHVEVADSHAQACEQAAVGWADGGMDAQQIADSPFVLAGTVAEIADELTALRARTGISHITVRTLPPSPFDEVVRGLARR